jgi:hypothetical protein
MSDLTYNAEFLENFKQKKCVQYDKTMYSLIKDWVSHLRSSGRTVMVYIQYLLWNHSLNM